MLSLADANCLSHADDPQQCKQVVTMTNVIGCKWADLQAILRADDATAGAPMSIWTQNAGKTSRPAVAGAAWLQMMCLAGQHPPAPAEPSGLPIPTEPPAHTHTDSCLLLSLTPKVTPKVTPKTCMHSCRLVSALASHI